MVKHVLCVLKLFLTLQEGRVDMTKPLLAHKDVNVNAKTKEGGWTPLHRAAKVRILCELIGNLQLYIN